MIQSFTCPDVHQMFLLSTSLIYLFLKKKMKDYACSSFPINSVLFVVESILIIWHLRVGILVPSEVFQSITAPVCKGSLPAGVLTAGV